MKVVIDGVEYVPAHKRSSPNVPPHKLFANARQAAEKTLREVAEASGLHINTIYNAESGSTVSLLSAIKLCRYYGIDLEALADSVEMQEKLK